MSTQVAKMIKERRAELGKDKVTVYDAQRDEEITVHRAAVQHSQQKHACFCAMSRAAKTDVKFGDGWGVSEVWTYKTAVWFHLIHNDSEHELFMRYIPDNKAQKAIDNFDEKKGFPKGKYGLLAPRGSATLEEIAKRSAKRKTHRSPGTPDRSSGIKRGSMPRHHSTGDALVRE